MGVSPTSEPNDRRRLFVTTRMVVASLAALAAASGVAACGSSSKSSTASTGGVKVTSGTINGAGSTLAAPVYQQWGSNLKGNGITLNYTPEWKSKVGADKTVKWPTGTGAKGNAGVAASVKQADGAVGYVEEAYALQNNFTTADVKNKSGKFVTPSLASTTAAASGVTVPADLGYSAIDSPNPNAYPIASQTFVDVFKDMCKAGLKKDTAQRIVAFLNYGLGDGQAVAKQLSYAALPSNLASKSKAAVSSLQCNGSPISG